MSYFAPADNEDKENELLRAPVLMRAFLERRAQQILESQRAIGRLQGSIRGVMFDIAHFLAATPSAANLAMLDYSFSDLKGLSHAMAVAETSAATPPVGNSGEAKGTQVDLTVVKAAIETHANSPSVKGANLLTESGDKINKAAVLAKELPSLDAAATSGVDRVAPGDTKPVANSDGTKPSTTDAPSSNLNRVKQALAKSGDETDPSSAAISDLLPSKPGARLNAGALKLDHAEAVGKADAPDVRVTTQGAEPTARAAAAKPEPVVTTALHKPAGPG